MMISSPNWAADNAARHAEGRAASAARQSQARDDEAARLAATPAGRRALEEEAWAEDQARATAATEAATSAAVCAIVARHGGGVLVVAPDATAAERAALAGMATFGRWSVMVTDQAITLTRAREAWEG